MNNDFWDKVTAAGCDCDKVRQVMVMESCYMRAAIASKNSSQESDGIRKAQLMYEAAGLAEQMVFTWRSINASDPEINKMLICIRRDLGRVCDLQVGSMVQRCLRLINIRNEIIESRRGNERG